MSFNSAQIEAIAHKEGPCMVLAGPGSGKTTVITKRIEYLIQEYEVKPEEILVITFSRAAAKEMQERFRRQTSGKYSRVTFGTFHGIYYGILKWAYQLTSENIFSEEEKYRLLQQIAEHMELEFDDEKDFLQTIAGEISIVKNGQIQIDTYQPLCCEAKEFQQIYQTYEEDRKRRRKIDFDDMLVLTCELFQKRPDILEKWQCKYRYILVDEFQDINRIQYDVIRMLAAPENNLFIVGDDDQSIYRFRGAKPEIMLNFPKDYPDTRKVVLDVNYRSTKSIVNGAARVICHNTGRFSKQMITMNAKGSDIHVQEVRHPIEESEYVIREIQKAIDRKVKPYEIAVLFRTNAEARTIIETCMERGIPFQMREHFPSLYEHFIGQNLITYMKMALGDRSRKSFLEIMNRPNRYIGRESVDKGEVSFEDLRKFYPEKEWMSDRIDQFESDLCVIGRCAPYAAIRYIRRSVGYDDFLREYARSRKVHEEDLFDVIDEIEERAKAFRTIEEWFAHIEEYIKELRRQEEYREADPDGIVLMTMHGAKGLEFHTVFIVGANEGITPYKKAITEEDTEEERRMFYVAMTRAKERLVISYSRERNGKQMEPSRFVEELFFEV